VLKNELKLNKLLKAMLSVCPDAYGLVLNEEGRISIKELHRAVIQEESFGYVTPISLTRFFEMNSDCYEVFNGMVRWKGLLVVPLLREESPPSVLYVAVAENVYEVVKRHGLKGINGRMAMFVSGELAMSVAKRRYQSPVLLKVITQRAMDRGCHFYLYGEQIYLCDYVPADAIVFPLLSVSAQGVAKTLKKSKSSEKKKTEDDAVTAGGFFLKIDSVADSELGRKRRQNKKQDPDWKIARRNSRRGGVF
jgi:putative RNA 2'-phosphotransferase